METVTVNGTQWKLESIDFVDVDGRRIWPWSDHASASNGLSSTALTPPVMDGVERSSGANTDAVPSPKPMDIESHLAALKAKRELQALLARPMTFGEFMDAWLRDARLREIENDVICELLRAVRGEAVAGPTDRRPS